MSTSFIVFIVLTIAIVAISAYRLGVNVSKAAKQEAPEAQNKIPYEKSLEKNTKKFKYGTFTDARDGETYRTVKIGGQTWMAENLRFKAGGSFAPDNDEANVKKFGRLYTWTTALGISEDYSTQSSANDIDQHNKIKDKHFQAGISRATRNGKHSSPISTPNRMVASSAANAFGRSPARTPSGSSPCRQATASTTARTTTSAGVHASGARTNTAD